MCGNRGPREHNDPPGYQSRVAVEVAKSLPGAGNLGKVMDYEGL